MTESENSNKDQWHSSKDAQKQLGIRSCELMHRRERGELKFEKRGNAYFYCLPGVERKEP